MKDGSDEMKRDAFTGLKHGEERGTRAANIGSFKAAFALALPPFICLICTHEVRGQRSHQQDDTNKEC